MPHAATITIIKVLIKSTQTRLKLNAHTPHAANLNEQQL